MHNHAKLVVVAVLAASAVGAARAADLEFHGYARGGLGFSSAGGNEVSFMQGVSGKSKFRLGNEADWCLEPSFSMSFTQPDDKSQWGVSMLPATYRRMNSPGDSYHNNADGGLPVSFKEFYFYGRNVPQLAGGEVWAGRRYFGRLYLGAINDEYVEAQDGVGAGVSDIPIGPAKLSFDVAAPNGLQDGGGNQAIDTSLSFGAHVASIPTFNKDSSLQIWSRVYLPMQKTSGNAPKIDDCAQPNPAGGCAGSKREIGASVSVTHVAAFGALGSLTVSGRFDQNAYTDVQDTGSGGRRNLEADAVYSVNVPTIRTSVDTLVMWRQSKSVKQYKNQESPTDDTMNLFMVGFRTDTQISGPFRFLLEAGYSTNKTKNAAATEWMGSNGTTHTGVFNNDKQHNLFKLTPCLAMSGGNDAWSRPTFRLFYTYAKWNDNGSYDVFSAWKDAGAGEAFAGKTAGGTFGIQAEGWW